MSYPATREAALADLPAKPRVHELSRRIGLSNKELLAVLADRGLTLRSASASVPSDVARDLIEQHFAAIDDDGQGRPVGDPAESGSQPAGRQPDPVELSTEAVLGDTPAPPPSPGAFVNPLFLAPEPVTAAPATERSPGSDVGQAAPSATDAGTSDAGSEAGSDAGVEDVPSGRRRRGRGRRKPTDSAPTDSAPASDEAPAGEAGADQVVGPDTDGDASRSGVRSDGEPSDGEPSDDAAGDDDLSSDENDSGRGRRRRRGRRGRGRVSDDAVDGTDGDDASTERDGRGAPASGQTDGATPDSESDDEDSGDPDGGATDETDSDSDAERSGGSRRRRRRRRRSGTDDPADTTDNDPADTVVHVREPRESRSSSGSGSGSSSNEVQGLRGSTRLEAKRQRRRDSRESRRRPQILTEAEFLARREAVDRVMAVRQRGDLAQVALLEDGILVEHFVSQTGADSLIGSVFLGRVQNVLPSMEAAFVDIGRGRNAVLYAGEVNWDAAGLAGKARRIETALSSGDSLLVQVSKDPIGHKGARLTTQIALPGRFLVYVPNGGATGISRKLPDTERKRLKAILDRIVPEDAGVIIRTAAEGIPEEELARDVERLKAQWEDISKRAGQKSTAPTRLYAEPGTLLKVVRDLFNSDINRLVIDSDDTADGAYRPVKEYVDAVAPELADRVERYDGGGRAGSDVFSAFRIDEQIAKALERKVHLPSGGSLVIDRTEAMTVVDVNTGKYTGNGGNLEETVTRNNLEAAEEIVRQLRLRDIGGIIVVDFIDMVLESNRELVLRRLTECLGRDRSRHQVAEVTSLGLVQMTRKRMGTGLVEAFSEPCPHCAGRGLVLHELQIPGPTAEAVEAATNGDRGDRGERRGRNRRRNGRAAEPEEIEVPPVPRVQQALRPDPRGPRPPQQRVLADGSIEAPSGDEITTVVLPAGPDADDVAEALVVGAVSASDDSAADRRDRGIGTGGAEATDFEQQARSDAGAAVAAVTAALRSEPASETTTESAGDQVAPSTEDAAGSIEPDEQAPVGEPVGTTPSVASDSASTGAEPPAVSTAPTVGSEPAAAPEGTPPRRPRRRAAGRAAGAPSTATAVDIVIRPGETANGSGPAAPAANGTVIRSAEPAPTGRRRAASRPAGAPAPVTADASDRQG